MHAELQAERGGARTPPPPPPAVASAPPPPPADALTTPLLHAAPDADVEAGAAAVATAAGTAATPAAASRAAAAAPTVSLLANVALLAAKLVAFYLSGSKAVLASTVDSVVDIASQAVLAAAARRAATRHPRFPVGRARMSAVGVASAAGIMVGATLLVVWESLADLVDGWVRHTPPRLDIGPPMFAILGAAAIIKAGLYVWCAAAAAAAPPGQADALEALAEDHRTDVAANAVALLAGVAARAHWEADPLTALLLSGWILSVWARVFGKQVDKIVGHAADAATMGVLEAICQAHAPASVMTVDVIRAFHWGERLIVETEVVMPPSTTVRASHDLALALQHKLEAVDVVERAFVHVDYERRAEPEHAVDRALSGLLPLDAASPNVPVGVRGGGEGASSPGRGGG